MVLDGEYRQLLVANTFHCAVVQVDVADLESVLKAIRVDGIAVVLGGDMHPSGGQFLDRVVAAAVAELELESIAAEGPGDKLRTEANAHYGLLP